jgi:hypothetical protein
MNAKTDWYRDNFLISTNPSLIQPTAVNAAFGSNLMYWTKAMDEEALKKMLAGSLCFGVYALPESSSNIAGPSSSLLPAHHLSGENGEVGRLIRGAA